MARFLIHQGRNAYPFGVYRSMDDFLYGHDAEHKVAYGRAVVTSMGHANTWDEWIEQLASKFPGPADQWDIIEADGTLALEEVLEEARASLTYGD